MLSPVSGESMALLDGPKDVRQDRVTAAEIDSLVADDGDR
jgi:hypothetical protein